jgi:hypothetical protein
MKENQPCLPPQKSIIPRGQYPHNATILKAYNCILSIEVWALHFKVQFDKLMCIAISTVVCVI